MNFAVLFISMIVSIIMLVAGVLGYWIFEPPRKIVIMSSYILTNEKGTVTNKFKRGETVYAERTMFANEPITHEKVWRTVMHEEKRLVYFEDLPPIPYKGGMLFRTNKVPLKADFELGKYSIHLYATYALNPVRNVTYEIEPPIHFEVVK